MKYTEQELQDFLDARQKSIEWCLKHKEEMKHIKSFALNSNENKISKGMDV